MTKDIFEFWQQINSTDNIHPADRAVFSRVGENGHGFDFQCLPCNFFGPLKTAPVVFLCLSPGLTIPEDHDEATNDVGQNAYVARRLGNQPLPSKKGHQGVYKWWKSRTKFLEIGDEKLLMENVSFFNIGAYHSKKFKDYPLLAALPSSRVALDWSQNVLFPAAEDGQRIVVCLRTAHFWGLETGQKFGRALFAPEVNVGAYILNNNPQRQLFRNEIKDAIRRKLGVS